MLEEITMIAALYVKNLKDLETELQDFFSRKYRMMVLALACYAAMC